MRTLWCLALVLSLLPLMWGAPALCQERPEAGEGSIFVDEWGIVGFTFVDRDGDFLQAVFLGSPGDFVRQTPDGRFFLALEDLQATVTVRLASGERFSGSAMFQQAVYVRCPTFDPASSAFECFFPADGNAVLNSHGTVRDSQGNSFDMEAHLTGIFLPAASIFRFVLSDIQVTPARVQGPGPVVVPTHLASVPIGTLIAVDESTGSAIAVGSVGFNSFSDLSLSDDGRLFGSLGFQGSGRIFEYDTAASMTIRSALSGFDAVPALDFGPAGTPYAGVLYGVGNRGGGADGYFLMTVDLNTLHGTQVGSDPIGVPFIDAIVFTNDGRLFGTGFVDGGAVLVEIDPASGRGTVIGQTGFASVPGLEVASDGSLLGSLGGADPRAGGIIRIDPSTGAGTFIGATGFAPVSGLTRLPNSPASPAM